MSDDESENLRLTRELSAAHWALSELASRCDCGRFMHVTTCVGMIATRVLSQQLTHSHLNPNPTPEEQEQ